MQPAEIHALLPGVVQAVRAAAGPVMGLFRTARAWDKDGGAGMNNPVTEADLLADAMLREALPALLPGSGWLSEETADSPDRLARRAVWIVDPIDGTREYVQGVPDFAISVALAWDGRPVLAALLNPARDDLYTAVQGGGATRAGAPIGGGDRASLRGATVLASRTETRRGDFAPFAELLTVQERGSTAWKLALLAAGEGDCYFTRKPRSEWDIAAGVLIAREAGLRVTDLGGQEHRFNQPDTRLRGVIAARPGIYAELFALIERHGTLEHLPR